MKKYLCTLAVVGLAASALGATGQVNMSSGSNLVKQQNGTGVAANGGFVQLFYAPANTAIAQAWDPAKYANLGAWLAVNPGWAAIATSIKPINGPTAGRFTSQVVDTPTDAPISAAIAAWTGTAATFDAAIAAGGQVGISGAFQVDPGNPAATPIPELPATTSGLFPGLTLAPATAVVPEPSSLALAGLGAAALLIFRRRK